MNNNNQTIKYPDPNDTVEVWKDRLYEEIKDLPKDQIVTYLARKADKALQRVSAAPKEKVQNQ